MISPNSMGRGVLLVSLLLSGTTQPKIAYNALPGEYIVSKELTAYAQMQIHSSMGSHASNVIILNISISKH